MPYALSKEEPILQCNSVPVVLPKLIRCKEIEQRESSRNSELPQKRFHQRRLCRAVVLALFTGKGIAESYNLSRTFNFQIYQHWH